MRTIVRNARMRSDLIRVGPLLLLLGLILTNGAWAGALPEITGEPTVGWNGHYVVGRWTPVTVPIHVKSSDEGPAQVQLVLSAVDPDGNRVRFHSPSMDLPEGEHRLEGLLKVGRMDGEIGISVNSVNETRGIPGRANWLRAPLKPSAKLIVTVGHPRGFDFEVDNPKSRQVIKIAAVNASDLPANPLAFDSVSTLVLAGVTELADARSVAMRDWVASGGRLVISLPQDIAAARSSLPSWVPAQIGQEPVIVREFGGLEAFSGKNSRIPQRATLAIPQVTFDAGEVLASTRSIPYLIRVPYGTGSVTILAMDLTSTPLSEWKELSAFCSKLVGATTNSDALEKGGNRGSQLSSTGITDLSTQLHAIQEHFENVQRVTPWFVMSWLLALLILIGPIDYLIVHRLLKRPYLTWITFPFFAALSAFLATSLSWTVNGTASRENQLNIINVDVVSGLARGRHFVNVYSPRTSQSSIRIEPLALISDPQIKPTARLIWEGIPESSFGGMLRDSGLERGATYQQRPDGELTEVPIMQWSSKGLVADSLSSAEGLIESNLRASPTGSLTGTILHRFASPIEDWMIVYQNRVYRWLKTRDDAASFPLPPKQIWRVEQPGVFQRELRPYLTGILTMATPRYGSKSSTDGVHQQSTYDPLSLDPFSVVRILTFHDEIGAEKYTGLTNQLLEDQDMSRLLKLGRAVLFGRIDQPLTVVRQDETILQPDRESSFVRLILPVTKSGEVLKNLKRVVPD